MFDDACMLCFVQFHCVVQFWYNQAAGGNDDDDDDDEFQPFASLFGRLAAQSQSKRAAAAPKGKAKSQSKLQEKISRCRQGLNANGYCPNHTQTPDFRICRRAGKSRLR